MMDKTSNTQRLCEGDRCFIEFSCALPALPKNTAGARIEKVLLQAKDTALCRAKAALSTLAARYAESTDPHKAMRHRPLFLLLEFSAEEKGCALRIAWTLSLSRGGRILSKVQGAKRFDKQSGYLLPCRERAKT